MRIWGKHRITAYQIIALGFLALILAGTALLMLPAASRQPGGACFSDCLFTATSAVCVTGLVVVDTASCWSPFGQAVILILIQAGGMGVVTAAVFLAFLSGRKIGLLQRSVMQESISAPQVGGIVRLTRFIIRTAAGIELAGALLLLPAFVPEFGWAKGFCNAGFDLMGIRGAYSSMTGFSGSIPVNAVLILLIVTGGIGFLVWDDVRQNGFRWRRYRLQSKIAVTATGVLLLLAALWFYLLEMQDLPAADRVLPALFQSATLRTAGFNTVDLNRISARGQAGMILWMLIGGSPGSTAGGMKTTSMAVLLLTAWSVYRRKEETVCFGRRIWDDALRGAAALLVMYILLFFTGGLIISRLESLPLRECLFETASALGTVGLSLGITDRLGTLSRFILMGLMFHGRVGGLTLIYAAQSGRRTPRGALPAEKITVG